MTTSDLMAFTQTIHGQTLHTRRGRPFRVLVDRSRIIYERITEDGGVMPQPEGKSALEKTVVRYRATGSTKTTYYQSFSVNSSYTLTLIDRYRNQNRR